MALNPNIILAGQQADIPGAFHRGLQMRQQAQLGDLQVQGAQQQAAGQQRQGEREQAYMDAKRGIALIDRATTPEAWDAIASRVEPELVGQFGKRDAIRAALEATLDAYDPSTPDEVKLMKAADGSIVQLKPNGQGGYDVERLTEGAEAKPPAGYRFDESGGLDYIPGGPADPKTRDALRGPGSSVTLEDGTRIDLFGGSGLGKKAQNDIEGKAINSAEMLTRLTQINEAFDPRFLEIETRLGGALARFKDRLGTASPEDKLEIAEIADFQRRAIGNLNTVLKEMSGAAVTPQEFERIKAVLPNPGVGIFDADSPAEFEAKMRDAILETRLAIMRYGIWQARGGTGGPEEIQRFASLDNPEAIVAMRIQMLEEEARSKGLADQAEIDALVENQIRQEIGN